MNMWVNAASAHYSKLGWTASLGMIMSETRGARETWLPLTWSETRTTLITIKWRRPKWHNNWKCMNLLWWKHDGTSFLLTNIKQEQTQMKWLKYKVQVWDNHHHLLCASAQIYWKSQQTLNHLTGETCSPIAPGNERCVFAGFTCRHDSRLFVWQLNWFCCADLLTPKAYALIHCPQLDNQSHITPLMWE